MHLQYLEQNTYEEYNPEQLREAENLLNKEMEVVRQGMAHGELSIDAYSQVWEECLAQVCLFVLCRMIWVLIVCVFLGIVSTESKSIYESKFS